jgi:LPS sulfotransferase NodH
MENEYQNFFKNYSIEPVRFTYEELTEDPRNVLKIVYRHLDMPFPESLKIPSSKVKKVGGELNDEWARKFEAENLKFVNKLERLRK